MEGIRIQEEAHNFCPVCKLAFEDVAKAHQAVVQASNELEDQRQAEPDADEFVKELVQEVVLISWLKLAQKELAEREANQSGDG